MLLIKIDACWLRFDPSTAQFVLERSESDQCYRIVSEINWALATLPGGVPSHPSPAQALIDMLTTLYPERVTVYARPLDNRRGDEVY